MKSLGEHWDKGLSAAVYMIAHLGGDDTGIFYLSAIVTEQCDLDMPIPETSVLSDSAFPLLAATNARAVVSSERAPHASLLHNAWQVNHYTRTALLPQRQYKCHNRHSLSAAGESALVLQSQVLQLLAYDV